MLDVSYCKTPLCNTKGDCTYIDKNIRFGLVWFHLKYKICSMDFADINIWLPLGLI